jgi:hypothetical protein
MHRSTIHHYINYSVHNRTEHSINIIESLGTSQILAEMLPLGRDTKQDWNGYSQGVKRRHYPYHEPVADHGWTVDENEVDIDEVEGDDGDDGDDGDGQAANMKDENEIELDFVLDYAGDDSGQSDANKKPRMEH